MTKLWCIAIAMGGPEEGMVVVSTQMSGLQEMAVAQAVSDVYRQTGTKLPLMGVNARELTREYLEAALRAMDEDEQKPAVVQLRSVGADYLEKHYGMKPTPLSEGPGPAEFVQWTDEMIANHFGQSKSKEEIEELVGRKIDWGNIKSCSKCDVNFPCWGDRSKCQRGFAA